MPTESYYCPLCGNRPSESFVSCSILEQPICNDCNSIIHQFFLNADEFKCIPPQVIERLSDYSGLTLKECKELWHKEQVVSLLLKLRHGINCFEESGDIWDVSIIKELLSIADEAIEAGNYLKCRDKNNQMAHRTNIL